MGKLVIFLCISFLGHFIFAQSVTEEQDVAFSSNLPVFFESALRLPLERSFDLFPYDTIFSSWRTPIPDFHWLNEVALSTEIPEVEVFCDKSRLTLFVDKRFNGVILDGAEIQLGDGCYSNGELPNHLIFTYGLDECGTTHVVQNDVDVFSNSFRFNLRKPSSTWWTTPAVHISCVRKRSDDRYFLASQALPGNGRGFDIKPMDSSWTSRAESNTFQRGQVIHLQVSANTRPDEQLFVQSCFISPSHEPHHKPRHAVIMNKGCAATPGSSHPAAQFVASDGNDVVNLVLNTAFLISEFKIHCSVLVSNERITSGSKSCNYNLAQSRWEELSGNVEVCRCCSSKCKSLSLKRLPRDAKGTVSTGLLVIKDKDEVTHELEETFSIPVANSMRSDPAEAEDKIISGASLTRRSSESPRSSSTENGVNPVIRLSLWLTGEEQESRHSKISSQYEDNLTALLQQSDMDSNGIPELPPFSTDREAFLTAPANEIKSENEEGDALTLFDGRQIPPYLEKGAIAEESPRKKRLEKVEPQDVDLPLPGEVHITDMDKPYLNPEEDELAQKQAEVAVMHREAKYDEIQPVVRSKLQFSKGVDGSQALSYEEEVVEQKGGTGKIRSLGIYGMKRREPGQTGLLSTFLNLLRRMDKAE